MIANANGMIIIIIIIIIKAYKKERIMPPLCQAALRTVACLLLVSVATVAAWHIAPGALITPSREASTRMGSLGSLRSRPSYTTVHSNMNRRKAAVVAALPFFFPGSQQAKAAGIKPTNEVVKTVNGIRHKRLGGGDIIVSEIGLGTQRWVSKDFNAPDEALCRKMMDKAILEGGVNLIDTAEQYPIPSDIARPEGLSEEVIGRWLKDGDSSRRSQTVVATKITGGGRINKRSIITACEGSLKRLQTDYIDVYQLHWPARYTPQSNWGQSLMYRQEREGSGGCPIEDQCLAMEQLIKDGKIRGWGMCNDNAYGITVASQTAKRLGTTPPVVMQGDFSMVNRRSEENGVTEASSPIHENVGFFGYNILAGGYLTGKYLEGPPPAWDDYARDKQRSMQTAANPRGRHDEMGWGGTLIRYRTFAVQEALSRYKVIADKNKMSMTELAIRWAKQRPGMTSALVGASSMKQLEEQLAFFRTAEKLPPAVMQEIDVVHMRNRLPLFSSDHIGADWDGEGEIGEPVP